MRKTSLFLAILLSAGIGNVWAGPNTTDLSSDVFDSTPDSTPTPNETGVPSKGTTDVKDAINLLLSSSLAHNENADSLQFTGNDNTWLDISASGHPSVFAAIAVNADYTNSLSVYDVNNPGTKINPFGLSGFSGTGFLGAGTFDNPFLAALSPFSSGTEFQWSITSVGGNTSEWDSNPVNNADGLDHMMTYQLTGLKDKSIYLRFGDSEDPQLYTFNDPYLITWEDVSLASNGAFSDQDFNDVTFLVDRVAPLAAPEPVSTVLFLTGGLAMAAGMRRRRNESIA